MRTRVLIPLILLVCCSLPSWNASSAADKPVDHVAIVASLIDPTSLSTLAERGAVPRVRKAVYWLHKATLVGRRAAEVMEGALGVIGWQETPAGELTAKSLLRNLDIAGKLGCLDEAGMNDLRRGHAPTIKTGPYAGDELSVDHIIPFSVCPELDNVIANLEFMPLKLNQRKSDSVNSRQRSLAVELHKAGLTDEKTVLMLDNIGIED